MRLCCSPCTTAAARGRRASNRATDDDGCRVIETVQRPVPQAPSVTGCRAIAQLMVEASRPATVAGEELGFFHGERGRVVGVGPRARGAEHARRRGGRAAGASTAASSGASVVLFTMQLIRETG